MTMPYTPDDPKYLIVISVSGGVAEVDDAHTAMPPGTEVKIVDWDNIRAEVNSVAEFFALDEWLKQHILSCDSSLLPRLQEYARRERVKAEEEKERRRRTYKELKAEFEGGQ